MVVVEVRERVQTILGPSYLSYHVRRSIGEPRPFLGKRFANISFGHPTDTTDTHVSLKAGGFMGTGILRSRLPI